MDHRSQILADVRKATGAVNGHGEAVPRPEDERGRLQQEWEEMTERRERMMPALVERFKKECEKVSGKVFLAHSRDDALGSLSRVISREGVKKVIIGNNPVLKGLDLEERLRDFGLDNIVRSSNEHLRDRALKTFHQRIQDAEMGITAVDYGLSDTGTLVLMARPNQD